MRMRLVIKKQCLLIGDPRLAMGSPFLGLTVSDKSDDRSSKSSTAARASKARHEAPLRIGYSDKNGLSSLSRKNLGIPAQQTYQGKGRADTNKKPRGEKIKIEKENSHSTLESDSRSPNFPFVQGSYTSTSNSTEGGKSMIHDGELNDEAQDSERPVDKELQADLDRRNCKEVGGVSQELTAESSQEIKNEKSENHCSSTDHDPMLDPSSTLQAVQDALERELWRFRGISNGDFINDQPLQDVGMPSEFTSGGGDFPGPSTSEPSQSRNGMQHSFDLDSEVVSLKQNVTLLQNNLYEAAKLVKFQEARVTELQSILSNCSEKEEKSVGIELHERTRDIEIELEDLFRQKIEAEVKYLTISRTVEKLSTAAVEQVKLLDEQKALASEQAQIVKNLGDAESNSATLKTQAKKLETCCEDIMSTDEMLMLQKRVWKYSVCFLIQLVLLVVLGLFLLQISPDDAEVVPT